MRAPYPRDQHGFPSTPSTRLTRLASLPRVCRSYLFYDGASTLIREAFSQYYSAEPQVAPQEARSPRGAGPMREKCGPHSQGSRRCRARSQQLGSLLGCAAERAAALGCLFASHLGNLCSLATVVWSVRAHTQREARMHAVCRGSRLSRGARASRACDSARVLASVARRVMTVARAEPELILDPDDDLRRFG